MTPKEQAELTERLTALVGNTRFLIVGSLRMPVIVRGAKEKFGRVIMEVEPVGGDGIASVNMTSTFSQAEMDAGDVVPN